MRKELILLALLAMIAFIGCKGNETTPEEDIDQYEGVPDNDIGFEENEDCCGPVEEEVDTDIPCGSLSDEFFEDIPTEWEAYFRLKMSGVIDSEEDQAPDFAFLARVDVTLQGTEYNLANSYGWYSRSAVQDGEGTSYPAVIAVSVGNLSWPVTDKLAAMWVGQTFVVVDDLLAWKTEAESQGHGDVTVSGSTQVTVFEVWEEMPGPHGDIRMECVRGLSAMNGDGTAYDGAMYFCTLGNTEWAVGEQMRMMQYAKMIDDPAELLAAMNEGLTPGDPGYRTDVCRCFNHAGMTMDCEAMKDEFGLGELPDEDALLTDETPDADTLLTD